MDRSITDSELLDFSRGMLDAARMREVEIMLDGSDDLRQRLSFIEQASSALVSSVESVASDYDTPFLTDKIMRSLAPAQSQGDTVFLLDFLSSLRKVFRPVVAATLVLIIVLAAYNVTSVSEDEIDVTTTEAVLGLQPVTVAAAYEYSF